MAYSYIHLYLHVPLYLYLSYMCTHIQSVTKRKQTWWLRAQTQNLITQVETEALPGPSHMTWTGYLLGVGFNLCISQVQPLLTSFGCYGIRSGNRHKTFRMCLVKILFKHGGSFKNLIPEQKQKSIL